MLPFVTIIIVFLVSRIANTSYVCNNASLEKMDIAMSKALNVGKYHRNFPLNYGQVDAFCE